MSDEMTYVIDWNLNQVDFRRRVREIIRQAETRGKVLALPVEMNPGQVSLDLMILLLSQVNCEKCDAECCKQNPYGGPIDILPVEYKRLAEKYGPQHFLLQEDKYVLPMPCPFLKQGRCSIYPDRPMICVIFPFQSGAVNGEGKLVMAVASSCPEGRRIARNIYMTAWRLRHQYSLLGGYNIMEDIVRRARE